MEITIEWTEDDINHVQKHNIALNEVESIFESKMVQSNHRKRCDSFRKGFIR